ncbi:MAG TPA: trypsin-like peptidase domain-containing protein [Acidimicrobiales bacterium]|nr:trypsin-like peptidase domain-containing protein [Acidimicrobiales bacterium]
MVAVTAVVAALIGAVAGLWVGLGSQHTVVEKYFPNRSLLAHPHDIQAVLAKVEPAVVSIDTTGFTGGTADGGTGSGGQGTGGREVEGAGTGMILTPDGEVLTNDHVVAGASTVTVTLFGQDDALPAHLVGTDPTQDLALVQIDGQHDLPTVSLGDSARVQVGDDVVAIGNALALQGGPTVTEGIVSATDRSLSARSDVSGATEHLSGLLQTDAPINPGNSGGPLVNADAEVVGMNTAVAQSGGGNAPAQDIGFAIAIDTIKPLLPGLRTGGTGGSGGSGGSGQGGAAGGDGPATTAYLGVVVENVTPQVAEARHLATTGGALVVGLAKAGPAAAAGVRTGDVVVSLDGAAVPDVATLVKDIAAHAPGDTVTVGIDRGGRRSTVSATLGSTPGSTSG